MNPAGGGQPPLGPALRETAAVAAAAAALALGCLLGLAMLPAEGERRPGEAPAEAGGEAR